MKMRLFEVNERVWDKNNSWGTVVHKDYDTGIFLIRFETGYMRMYQDGNEDTEFYLRKEYECDEGHQSFWMPWLW